MSTERNATRADAASLLDRPLTARSVIASLLLGRHPPAASAALLVRWCALFGISGTSARVALSRMVERGELETSDSNYSLRGRIRTRQPSQDFALAPELRAWDGEWRLAVVGDAKRAAGDRQALRDAFGRLHLVEARDGVWCRPDNLPARWGSVDDRAVVDAQCVWWRGSPDVVDQDLVERFDARGWSTRAATVHDALVGVTRRLPDPEALADGFVIGAAAAQHLRRDPLLPPELLPARWPGDALRAAYASYLTAFGAAVSAWTRALPPAAPPARPRPFAR